MHRLALGDDEQTRRVPIEPVNDPCSTGVLPALGTRGERLREGARPVTPSGMHDHSRGLVDDHQMRILEDDLERHVLRDIRRSANRLDVDIDPLTGQRPHGV